jgi:hypothetical protein
MQEFKSNLHTTEKGKEYFFQNGHPLGPDCSEMTGDEHYVKFFLYNIFCGILLI